MKTLCICKLLIPVYYLKYTELKCFFGHQVWVAKPVYWLLNPGGYAYAKGQCDPVVCSARVMTKSPVPKVRYFVDHFFVLTKISRYILINLCQNMLVAHFTCFHLALYIISDWLKFPGGKFGSGGPNRKW